MDNVTKEKRSEIMRKIKSSNTTPENHVKNLLLKLECKNLKSQFKKMPGTPDFVIKNRAIFVNGCFWHNHKSCKYSSILKSNTEKWLIKFKKNISRDRKVKIQLTKLGIKYLTIWACELKNEKLTLKKLKRFINEEKR